MTRRIIAALATMAVLAAGLMTPAPAQAAGADGAAGPDRASLAGCRVAQRFTFTPVQEFIPGDCYDTPGGFLYFGFDGFRLEQANRVCTTPVSDTAFSARFTANGLFIYGIFDDLVWRTPPSGEYHARLILRGGDGTLLIRNQFGQEIWRLC